MDIKVGHCWRFVTINTHSSWLPGDERGFRNRDHRIHSSGDYKNPPPKDEHAGLRKFNQDNSTQMVKISKLLRSIIGLAIIARLKKEGYRILAISVSFDHVHILVELPDDIPTIKRIMGRCKRNACEAVKHEMPGTIWSSGGDWKPVDDQERQDNSYNYVLTKQRPRAWTWSFKDGQTQALLD